MALREIIKYNYNFVVPGSISSMTCKQSEDCICYDCIVPYIHYSNCSHLREYIKIKLKDFKKKKPSKFKLWKFKRNQCPSGTYVLDILKSIIARKKNTFIITENEYKQRQYTRQYNKYLQRQREREVMNQIINEFNEFNVVSAGPQAFPEEVYFNTTQEIPQKRVGQIVVKIKDEPTNDKNMQCNICMENKKCVKFDPCKHVASCNSCAEKLIQSSKKCHICKTIIEKTENVYI